MNRVRELRTQQGLKQSDLAKMINVKDAAISKYENERIPLTSDTILLLADIFNVSTDYLLGRTDYESNPDSVEWKYPKYRNRFGRILLDYRNDSKLSCKDFASKLDISEELEKEIESGEVMPSFDLLKKLESVMNGYSIDYLVGAIDTTSVHGEPIEIEGKKYNSFVIKTSYLFKSRFEDLCLRDSVTGDNCEELVGLSRESFIDIRFNRMPSLSELLRLSYSFHVSLDYLIGKTDTPIDRFSDEELDLVMNYRDCLPVYKKNVFQRAYQLSLESIKEKEKPTELPKASGK